MSRDFDAIDGTVMFACAICGFPARYGNGEMRRMSDGAFLCFRHPDTERPLDYERKQGTASKIKDPATVPFPLGGKPGWWP